MNRKSTSIVALLAAWSVATVACGSQLDQKELEAANGAFKRTVDVADSQHASSGGELTFTDAAGATSDGAAAAAGSATGAITGSGTSTGAATSSGGRTTTGGATGSATSATPGAASGTGGQAATGTGGAATPGATAPGAPVPGAAGAKTELLLGSFGAESGVLGAVSGPAPPAIRAWSAYINAKGGINGHPVRVILGDDNADPARTLAIVRQMVERDKVIAFFNDYSFTLAAATKYLEEHQIPVIGSIGGDAIGDHSPMVFHPLVGPDTGQAWGFLLTIATMTDKKKLGIMYCREAATCAYQKASFQKLLPWNGLEAVYEAQVSLAQPDYTAEILQAKNAGAEIIVSLVDSASLARLAQAAHRQNWNPIFSGTYNLNQDLVFAGGKDVDGLILTSRSAPWDTSPKMQEYRTAMDRYQPKSYRGDLGGGVFVIGRMVEEKIGPFLGDTPTTAQVLEGLYALKNETLGGLLPGVGFEKGPHGKTNMCVVPVRLTNGKFVAHDAAESFVCAPGWKPVGT